MNFSNPIARGKTLRPAGTKTLLVCLLFVAWIQHNAFADDKQADKTRVPDFTAGDKLPAGAEFDFNLGPTGMRGWMWTDKTPVRGKARQILVTKVDADSPAAGKILENDVIVGVSGKPFDSDARVALADAITKAEETEQKGNLDLLIWRNGKTSNVTLSLAVMGSYSATAPYNCPKSTKILENGYAFLARKLEEPKDPLGGLYARSVAALALLNSGDPKYLPLVKRVVDEACAIGEKPSTDGNRMSTWPFAYANLLACEYYLSTTDKSVLPSIQRLTTGLVNGQSMYGTWGHGFAPTKQIVGGYGELNSASLPATISLVLARESGVEVNGLNEGIGLSARFFQFYVDKGSIPYGDHPPQEAHDDNGKSGLGAVLFDLLSEARSTRFFARMSTAAYLERQGGHTGHYFSFLWGPLGSFRSGPEAFQAHFKQIRWYLDLARKADGSFVYQPNPGVWSGATNHKYGNWDCTGAHLLTYAAMNNKIYITGKKGISAAPLHGEELAETMQAGELLQSEYDELATETLMQNLQSWSSAVRSRSAIALAKKEEDFAPRLIGMLNGSNRNARLGACEAFAAMAEAAAKKDASVAVKERAVSGIDTLTSMLNDPDLWIRIQASLALAAIGEPARKAGNVLMARMIQKDETDPLRMLERYSSRTWFSTYRGGKLFGKSLEGIDPALIKPVVLSMLSDVSGEARGGAAAFLKNLPLNDLEPLLPEFFRQFEAGPHQFQTGVMFSKVDQLATLDFLSSNQIDEGLVLCLKWVRVGVGLNDGVDGEEQGNDGGGKGQISPWHMNQVSTFIVRYGSTASPALPYYEKYLSIPLIAAKIKSGSRAELSCKAAYEQIKNGNPVELVKLDDFMDKARREK